MALARGNGSADVTHNGKPDSRIDTGIVSELADADLPSTSQNTSAVLSNQGTSAADASDDGAEEYDMFAEDEGGTAKSSKGNGHISHENGAFSQSSTSPITADAQSKFAC